MNYVVIDLEWNTVFVKSKKGFLNEIIEVGAIKLDENFNVLDTFTSLIKPKFSSKLSGRVKTLTSISNDDLKGGKSFIKTMNDFKNWLGKEDTVIFSWGDTDIRTLIENYGIFLQINYVPFLKKFCDAQRFFQIAMNIPTGNQIGLSNAAELLQINTEELSLHRALADCALTVECVKRVYDEEKIKPCIKKCDNSFYQRMFFKPKTISDINNRIVDKSELYGDCPVCLSRLKKNGEWFFKSDFFRCGHRCESCGNDYVVCVRFRKYFDNVKITRKVQSPKPKKEAKETENATANSAQSE